MDESLKEDVSRALRVLRAQRGWSQGDLAEASGISRQTISEIERGVYMPKLSTIDAIARSAGLRVSELMILGEPAA